MRAFAVAGDVVVMLPDIAGAPILGNDVVDHVRPQLGVDLAGQRLVRTPRLAASGERERSGGIETSGGREGSEGEWDEGGGEC